MGLYFRHPSSLEHDTGTHPENAGRLRVLESHLAAQDFLGLWVVEAPAASTEQIELVHPPRHRREIEALAALRD